MDLIHTSAPVPRQQRPWSELAVARCNAFKAQDAMAAVFLERAESGASSIRNGSGSIGAPPFVFALEKPAAPRSWRERRAARKAKLNRRQELLNSGLLDDAWYRDRYPDVAQSGQDPLTHFLDHGSYEGRSPGPSFHAMGYLARYPDVVEEKIEPWLHFVRHGKPEGRSPG